MTASRRLIDESDEALGPATLASVRVMMDGWVGGSGRGVDVVARVGPASVGRCAGGVGGQPALVVAE